MKRFLTSSSFFLMALVFTEISYAYNSCEGLFNQVSTREEILEKYPTFEKKTRTQEVFQFNDLLVTFRDVEYKPGMDNEAIYAYIPGLPYMRIQLAEGTYIHASEFVIHHRAIPHHRKNVMKAKRENIPYTTHKFKTKLENAMHVTAQIIRTYTKRGVIYTLVIEEGYIKPRPHLPMGDPYSHYRGQSTKQSGGGGSSGGLQSKSHGYPLEKNGLPLTGWSTRVNPDGTTERGSPEYGYQWD